MPKTEQSKRKDRENTKQADAKTVWDVTSTKGKITQECLWTACKAMSAGFFLILVGTGMATLGFYSDVLSKVERKQGNVTVLHKDEKKDIHLSSLTYLGPAVMGIGGFIILAACVMTFEARDTASKIVPAFFRKSRIHALQAMGSSPSRHSSDTSWERFLANSCWRGENSSKTRSLVTRELKNFSKKLQSSIDSAKLATVEDGINTNTLKKCPSEPFVSRVHQLPIQTSCKEEEEKVTLPLPEMGKPKPKSLLLAANIYRQAASMDCPKRALQRQEAQEEATISNELPLPDQKSHLPVQRSESNSSMAMDLYLPQGAVTLHVKDKTKGKKGAMKHTRHMSVSETNEPQVSELPNYNLDLDKASYNQEGRRNRSPALSKQQSEIVSKRRMSVVYQTQSMKRNPLMRQTAIDVAQESPKSTHSTEPA